MTAEYDARLWYDQIPLRHSVRAYDGRKVPDDMLDRLDPFLSGFSELCRGARGVLLDDAGDVFTGIIASLGRITGVSTVAVFIGDTSVPEYMEAVGYLGEGVILQATSLGLGTCWIAGTFNRNRTAARIKLGKNERVVAITSLGFSAEKEDAGHRLVRNLAKSRKRKPLEDISGGLPPEKWPPGCREALEAARLAPSALNRQPWFFEVNHGEITLSVQGVGSGYGSLKRLDCGIAMLHFEVAARVLGLKGHWELQEPPRVARFVLHESGSGTSQAGR